MTSGGRGGTLLLSVAFALMWVCLTSTCSFMRGMALGPVAGVGFLDTEGNGPVVLCWFDTTAAFPWFTPVEIISKILWFYYTFWPQFILSVSSPFAESFGSVLKLSAWMEKTLHGNNLSAKNSNKSQGQIKLIEWLFAGFFSTIFRHFRQVNCRNSQLDKILLA